MYLDERFVCLGSLKQLLCAGEYRLAVGMPRVDEKINY